MALTYFKRPVAWLGGRDLLANIKYFLLFALSSGKLDLRDWMQPEVFPGKEILKDLEIDAFWAQYQKEGSESEFWFDYVADSGDGMKATFSLGYLMHGDLYLRDEEITILDTPERRRGARGGLKLKRGAFLFVGGDTTYHVADYASLSGRFVAPLVEAIDQYEKQNRSDLPARPVFGIPGNHDYYDELDGFNRQFRKPITKEGCSIAGCFLDLHGRNLFPQLHIKDFERYQSCSYVAIALPFDWWLWGIDCEIGRMDLRQQDFFKKIRDKSGAVPRKLIVATPEPTTVEGRRSLPDEKTAQAFIDLRLTQPFVYLPSTDERGNPVPSSKQSSRRRKALRKAAGSARHQQKVLGLNSFDCRLDISGDTHHYERYWGNPTESSEGTVPANYASVVSGGGGASMSPTQVDVGDVCAVRKFPDTKTSSRVVNYELFNPWSVVTGGNVWAAGAVISILLYLTAIATPEHSGFTDTFFKGSFGLGSSTGFTWVNAAQGLFLPFIMLLACALFCGAIFFAYSVFLRLTRTYDLANNFKTNVNPPDSPRRMFEDLMGQIRGDVERDADEKRGWIRRTSLILFISGFILAGAIFLDAVLCNVGEGQPILPSWVISSLQVGFSVAILAVTTVFARRCNKAIEKIRQLALEADTRHRITRIHKLLAPYVVGKYIDYLPFWSISLIGFAWIFVVVNAFITVGYPSEIGQAVICFLGLLAVGIVFVGSVLYSAWLFAQAYRIRVTTLSYGPVIGYNLLGALILGSMIWILGSLPFRLLTLDVAAIVVITAIFAGCISLALFVGNKTDSPSYKILFFLFGLWHAILQIATPFLVIWMGGSIGFVLAAALILLVFMLRRFLVKVAVAAEPMDGSAEKVTTPRLALVMIWLVLGIVFMAGPYFISGIRSDWLFGFDFRGSNSGYAKLAGVIVTGITGALLSCFWLGWYFAISLLFNGHGNEAGSTARTERYKQFIRFRLTDNTLTGYVIGLEEVEKNGDLLEPILVDCIELKCRP